jgi:2-amino-4-hydroxy-6-hydroxymethyldihydropteridine diphosphokinase
MNKVFIGLGSNLDDPVAQLKQAIDQLNELENVKLIATSAFYKSKPMGPQDQPDFVNAVVEIETGLSAEILLDELQAIELSQGRVRKQHWGPRTLDLDVLLYGHDVISSERLTVPHPGIAERNFVLCPLADITGLDFKIPGMGKIKELLTSCPVIELQRL